MRAIVNERMTVRLDGAICVFLIGMRINRPWKIHKWLPVAMAMPRMVRELEANPNLGFLSGEAWFGRTTIAVQYWRSFEHLTHYARNTTNAHLPAWKDFTRRVGNSGDVGVWHETYQVSPRGYECIYHNMPTFGLGRVGTLMRASGAYEHATGRMEGGLPN